MFLKTCYWICSNHENFETLFKQQVQLLCQIMKKSMNDDFTQEFHFFRSLSQIEKSFE